MIDRATFRLSKSAHDKCSAAGKPFQGRDLVIPITLPWGETRRPSDLCLLMQAVEYFRRRHPGSDVNLVDLALVNE